MTAAQACPEWCRHHWRDADATHETDYAEMHYQFAERDGRDVTVNRAIRVNGEVRDFIHAAMSIEREMSAADAREVGQQFIDAAELLESIEATA